MKNFTYQGKEYNFFYTMNDETVVERYDNAERKKNAMLEEVKAQGLPKVEENRAMLKAITTYIDEVIGDGTCNTILGESTTPTEIMKLANTLFMYVATRMSEENTAVEKPQLNREQRRAKK